MIFIRCPQAIQLQGAWYALEDQLTVNPDDPANVAHAAALAKESQQREAVHNAFRLYQAHIQTCDTCQEIE